MTFYDWAMELLSFWKRIQINFWIFSSDYLLNGWWIWFLKYVFSSIQFSLSVVSDSLPLHELRHTRPPCPSPSPGVYPNSCPLSQYCHPSISSSVATFFSCPQCFPASGSFQMSQLKKLIQDITLIIKKLGPNIHKTYCVKKSITYYCQTRKIQDKKSSLKRNPIFTKITTWRNGAEWIFIEWIPQFLF